MFHQNYGNKNQYATRSHIYTYHFIQITVDWEIQPSLTWSNKNPQVGPTFQVTTCIVKDKPLKHHKS